MMALLFHLRSPMRSNVRTSTYRRPELEQWVEAWAAEYPVADDDTLDKYRGCRHLDAESIREMASWKFSTFHARHVRTAGLLNGESEQRIIDLTGRAFDCNDELEALLLVCELRGVGPATGSSLLMVQNPDKYTVIDTRALKSLRAWKRLPDGSPTPVRGSGSTTWPRVER